MNPISNRLKEFLSSVSKHSQYQAIPERVQQIADFSVEPIIKHYEKERFDFIRKHVDFKDKTVLDIGGNTGYFSFGALDEGASHVTLMEGNHAHALFVKELSEIMNERISVHQEYFNFEDSLRDRKFNIVFNLNVIHHLGDDFGDKELQMEAALKKMKDTFHHLVNKCDTLIFQMGFCWKGNRDFILFPSGTKKEMIDFVTEAIENEWRLTAIGIPEIKNEKTVYSILNETNVVRADHLGEFRNRPLFIIKRKEQ